MELSRVSFLWQYHLWVMIRKSSKKKGVGIRPPDGKIMAISIWTMDCITWIPKIAILERRQTSIFAIHVKFPGWELHILFPAGTFELVIFLFPTWDMLVSWKVSFLKLGGSRVEKRHENFYKNGTGSSKIRVKWEPPHQFNSNGGLIHLGFNMV